jgi:sucrose phosphorylase
MLFYIRKGVRILRLDAIAFLWKEKNTSCLHLPGTHEVVKLLRDIAGYVAPGTLILTETNVPQPENFSYFGKGDEAHMVYQFSLPPLLLYTLLKGNAEALCSWAEQLPALPAGQTFLNFTASHDGIGFRPLEGILPPEEARQLAAVIRKSGGLISERNQPDGTTGIYELNVTWFSAMQQTFAGEDAFQEARFLTSQLIMLALQGIPALYIQCLLAASNDEDGVRQTGRARSINRKSWDEKEIRELEVADSAQGRLFRELLRVLDLRRSRNAFHPDAMQQVLRLGDPFFTVKRGEGNLAVTCISNVTASGVKLEIQHAGSSIPLKDLLSGQTITGSTVNFTAYQTRWLTMSPETP